VPNYQGKPSHNPIVAHSLLYIHRSATHSQLLLEGIIMKRNQSGFTLIEIAIVLVIIGLLLGGVLKGQELINSAKVKNLAGDFKNIPLFMYGYQDKFKALPGDDAAADIHLSGGTVCTTPTAGKCAPANGLIDGAWDSPLGTDTESNLFWQHVRLAGFAAGTTTPGIAGYKPTNATGGQMGIQSNVNFTTITSNAAVGANTGITSSYVICSAGILGKFAKQLDITLDNGDTDSGVMRTTNATAAGKSIATVNVTDGDSFTVCMGF
jgi:prepilin-type N-terminal cleavage/methylation domain-containing protein